MKKTIFYCIALSIIALISCSSPKKVKTANGADAKEAAEQITPNNNTQEMTKVLLKTTLGDITIALYDDTPAHRDNFHKLVNDKFYDGVLFHRIIKGFMIQGGDPDSKTAKPGQRLGSGDVGYTIPAEFVPAHFHKRGAVCAARMGDNVNPQKASSGCQFYIVDGTVYDNDKLNMIAQRTGKTFSPEQVQAYTTIGGAPFLDGDYTVFGEVINGMEVVDKIASQQKDGADRPLEDIKIISATMLR
ncbi:MAG: peptidylprolyl isomerase [Bacteroidales bacterium]|nr:peptidylprolyl isomerase [Bacteroidales bacterium]